MKSFAVITTMLLSSAFAAPGAGSTAKATAASDGDSVPASGDRVALPAEYAKLLNPGTKISAAIASATAHINGIPQNDFVNVIQSASDPSP
ncbi:hypothetical protein G7Z17_g1363 [Cylindrodendrum hubeiense]|uniref:Uncharacterized protein n=1 Tax=Cylindrodendrum hubeiense TaxID=595255 RepID=A0A9P5HN15_9HYPO|nr:hypothetical protein G7Z17_g1363 [Cylindrodendrum hubeiense]